MPYPKIMGRGKNKADFPMDHFDNNFRIRFSDAGSVSEPGIESNYACRPKKDLFWIASPRRSSSGWSINISEALFRYSSIVR